METKISEIADGIYRLSTFVPEIAPPAGFTFNQFLVLGDEPLLFHTGPAQDVPARSATLWPAHPARAPALDRLRPLRGRRVRRDERVARGRAATRRSRTGSTGCMVSLNDMADRAPRVLGDGEVIDLGGASACATSTRRTPRTAGTPACSTRRRPARCSAATSSPSSATARR